VSNIIASDSRTAYVAGLRDFANFLESNPDVQEPGCQSLLLPLMTNSAVEEFAAKHGLTVDHDDEGNTSCNLRFGPITFHAYGYTDFAEHRDATDERNARKWAAAKGLKIVKPLVSDETIRQAENLMALSIADRDAAEAEGGAR